MTPDESLTPTPALVEHLKTALAAAHVAPGGVWGDPAPDVGETVFVTVLLQSDLVQHCGEGCKWHDCLYAIKAVGPAKDIADVRRAAVRLDAAVTVGVLTWPGWHVMGRWLESAIEYPDPEPTTGIRWEHRGGQYRLQIEERCA